MDTREWALLIFSILAQLAVGMVLVLMIVRTYALRQLGEQKAAQLTDLPFYAVVPTMILALVASLFHLGNVMNVIGAVPNLATSWMSREVVFGVLFMVLTAAFAFLLWRKAGSPALRNILGWVTAVVGLGLIYFMGMTYMLPVQPAWNTLATPVNFYLTTFLLGVLGTVAMLMFGYAQHAKDAAVAGVIKNVLQTLALAALVLVGLQFLVLPLYMAYLSTQGPAAIRSLDMMFNDYGAVLALRILFVFAGAGVLAAYLYRKASLPDTDGSLPNMAYSAFALVLLGEILSRFLFYATHYRIGV